MMDRFTARALVEAGSMSSEEYLRLFGDEIRESTDKARAEHAQRKEMAQHASVGSAQQAAEKADEVTKELSQPMTREPNAQAFGQEQK